MKKIGFVLFTVIAALSAINCGSAACDDYAAKLKTCSCASLSGDAKTTCEKNADSSASVAEAAGSDACQTLLDALSATCK